MVALACAGKSISVPTGKATCVNEPAGYTLAQDRSFTEIPPAGPLWDSFGWQSNRGESYVANLALITDASVKALTPDGTSSVLQMTFPQGFGGGAAPIWFGMREGGPGLPMNGGAIYMCVVAKIDARWTHNGNAGTKFFFFRTPYEGLNGQNHFWGFGPGDGDPTLTIPMFATQFGSGGDIGTARYSTVNAGGGVWRQIEVLFVAESPAGAKNGRGQMWLDGVSVLDNGDIQFFFPGQAPRWTRVEVEPTYGGGLNPVPYTMNWWLARVRVSVK